MGWLAGGVGLAWAGSAEAAWKLVKVGGVEYVTAQGIKEFYKFSVLERSGSMVALRSPRLVLRLRSGSQEMFVNGVKFMLSLPTTSQGKDVLVSRIDLSKLIDPVLRPSHIAQGPLFTTVVVDPGHGGHDAGARGVFGNEETYTLDTSLRLAKQLKQRGFKVVMTRTSDTYPSLPQRVEIANRTPSSVFVSVHYNSGGSSAQGIETYALAPQGTNRSRKEDNENDEVRFRGNTRDSENIALATAVHASMLYQLKAVDRGILRDRWFLLKGIQTPGILVEGGFITSPVECAKIHNPLHRERIAAAIAAGVVNYRNALKR
ncbi:MAG: N-acetylmuramoyl-L-alanine amidase [Verrucomicrobiales bacterium]